MQFFLKDFKYSYNDVYGLSHRLGTNEYHNTFYDIQTNARKYP